MSTTSLTDVIIGVDTHKDVHAAVAISALGAQLSATTIPASSKGYQALETCSGRQDHRHGIRTDMAFDWN